MDHELWHGDACAVCDAIEPGTRFDLVYLDPPYSVGTVMAMREASGQARGRKQRSSGRDAYVDHRNTDALIAALQPLMARIRDRLSDRGSFYLHLDWRAVHEAKVAADRVFGRRAFAGEIIWTPGNGSRGARAFAMTHQTILVYAARDRKKARFFVDHPLCREPYAETSQQMHFTKFDEDGRRFRERVIGGKSYRYYADQGRRIGSVWSDIPAMVANTPLCKEATGYPTQKPELLLERIIRAATEQGDTVVDPMCGSGTTLIVAARVGRRFIGGDASPAAIEVTRNRLAAAGVRFREGQPEASRAASSMAAAMPASNAVPLPCSPGRDRRWLARVLAIPEAAAAGPAPADRRR